MSQSEETNPLAALSSALSGVVDGVSPSIVAVRSRGAHFSGFVWKPGLIVTADEPLSDEGEITVAFKGGRERKAAIVGRDPGTDIALLRVEGAEAAPVTFAANPPAVGALALAVGASRGATEAALGIVSLSGGAWRSMRGGELSARLELGLSLRRSSEGGLALDHTGHPFGMAVLGPRRRVLVIPSVTIDRVASLLEKHGRIPRGYLGLGLQRVKVDGAEGGVIVVSVDSDGPGAKAGVKQGDIIVAWSGSPVGGLKSLMRSLGPDSIGTTVKLSLRRAGEPASADLTIGERPRD
jgi:S1-C subfamily serine protease